jgi:lysozyme family protein
MEDNMSLFDSCFAFTVGVEDGYTDNPEDPGNWTGGVVGRGAILGTKYGISAATYPNINISALTLEGAKTIYQKDQWVEINGDSLTPEIALVVFDSAVNSGVKRAIIWVQDALSITADGVFGPETRQALALADSSEVAREILARRIDFLAQLSTWGEFGLGWSRRITKLAFKAAEIA